MAQRKMKLDYVLRTFFSFLAVCLILPFEEGKAIAKDDAIKWRLQASIVAFGSPTYAKNVVAVADQIKAETKGRLVIETFPAGALIPNEEIFPAVKRGMLEMGYSVPVYWKSDIPVSQVCTLPFAFKDYSEVDVLVKSEKLA